MWVELILALFDMIRKCIEDRNSDRESVEAMLNRPGIRVAGGIRRALRKEGFRGRDLHGGVQEAMEELDSMSPVEVEELVGDALAESDKVVHAEPEMTGNVIRRPMTNQGIGRASE